MEQSSDNSPSSSRWIEVTVAAAATGAALIHAAAIGPHNGHGVVPGLFAIAAIVGLASGVAVLVRPARSVLVLVAAAQLVMLATWVASRTVGIGFISGLEDREAVGFPDVVAAAFELLVVVGALRLVWPRRRSLLPRRVATAGLAPIGLATLLLCGPATFAAATERHGHDDTAVVDTVVVDSGAAHDHGGTAEAAAARPGNETTSPATAHDHSGATAAPFDPAAPIDLAGTPGVTQVQQKEAELLLAQTLEKLPQFATQSAAFAAGYRSIGDSSTGDEHLINWSLINDNDILDPDHPESLVYDTRTGSPVLEAAMYILPNTYTLDTVPKIGGVLIQWHIHDDLCFTKSDAPLVAGITTVGGSCSPGLQKFQPLPMIHVWIRKNPCGPFASLEGIGGGQTKDGTKACDHAHGSTGADF